jgi:transcriptional regulator with XRE-family HTH domain
MSRYIDIEQLAAMIRAKRGQDGLRQVAQEIGDISPSTLSRVENGKLPDMDTFLQLCNWLGVDPARFFKDDEEADEVERDTPEIIEGYLRADKELDPETAAALATMIRSAYKALRAGKIAQ